MKSKDTLYWIWLSLRMGVGREGVASILEHFGSPDNVYNASADEIADFYRKEKRPIRESLLDKKLDEAYRIDTYCNKNHIDILRYSEKGYPMQLTTLKNPPVILYARGKIDDLDSRVAVGVVGTRSLSEYGRHSAYKIGYELAAAGAVVVSGLALGIDSVAACGALDARGRTVAILGSGLDRVYPPAHKKLARDIEKHGLLLSEYPPLTPPSRGSFPMRNRIISGMCQATLVVEAGEKSGALITAKEAILQGRQVYAIPGNIDAATAQGTNTLIKDGAVAVTCAADILDNHKYFYGTTINLSILERIGKRSEYRVGVLAAHGVDEGEGSGVSHETEKPKKKGKLAELLHVRGKLDGETVKRVSGETEYPVYNDDKREQTAERQGEADSLPEGLSDAQKQLLSVMPKGVAVGMEIINGCGLDSAEIISVLTVLGVSGIIRTLPGNLYIRE